MAPPAVPAAGTLAAILADMTSFVTSSVGWITSYVGAITSNPLIELFVVSSLACIGVGLLKRLMRA